MRTPKAGITGEEWLTYKPYDRLSRYDQAYLAIADELLKRMRGYQSYVEVMRIEPEDLRSLAVIWASYLEDLANDIGLWSAFSERCQAEFGYPVPLYPIYEGYTPGAVNWQDLAFIAWHYVSTVSDAVVVPDIPFLQDLSLEVAPWLAKQLRQAPTTDFYEEYLIIDPEDEDDFFYLRDKLSWVGTGSYLTLPSAKENMAREMEAFTEDLDFEDPLAMDFVMQVGYTVNMRIATSDCTTWAGLSAAEWLAELVDASDEYLDHLTGPLPRFNSFFRYLDENDQYYQWLELTQQQRLDVVRESVDLSAQEKSGEGGMFATLVQWKGEWWLSGGLMYYPKVPSPLTPSQSTIYWLSTPEERAVNLAAVADLEKAFLEVLGAPVVCFDSKQEAEAQLEKVMVRFRSMKSLSSEQKQKEATALMLPSEVTDEQGRLAATFVKGESLRFRSEIPGLVDLMQKEPLTKNEAQEKFHYLLSGFLHPDEVAALLQVYPQQELRVPVPGSTRDLLPYVNFLAYFFQPGAYEPRIPQLPTKG